MVLIEEILRHVLLVEDIEVLHAGCDRMVFVLDPDRENVRFWVAAEITAKQLIVQTLRWVHRMSVVHGQEASAFLYEIPNRLLLIVRHPRSLRLAIPIRPVTAVAG